MGKNIAMYREARCATFDFMAFVAFLYRYLYFLNYYLFLFFLIFFCTTYILKCYLVTSAYVFVISINQYSYTRRQYCCRPIQTSVHQQIRLLGLVSR